MCSLSALASGELFYSLDLRHDIKQGMVMKTIIYFITAIVLVGSATFGQSCVTTQTLGGSYRTTCSDGSSATHSQNLGGGVTTRYNSGGFSTTSQDLSGNVVTDFFSGGNVASSGAGTAYNNFYGTGSSFGGAGNSFGGSDFFGN